MLDFEIRLSGTVELRRNDASVGITGKRLRALMVLLAVSADQVVSVDTLVRGIWDDDPPVNVRASLQTYIGRLRKLLGEEVIATEASGYSLKVPREAVDLLRFEELMDGAAATDERANLHAALALWRGNPFGDAPSYWIERQLAPYWMERHLRAFERRVDLDLAAGDHANCVPELRDLIERHPLRETLWARLLTALQGAGRTADALERYETIRSRLADELGVDPAPELQEIYQRLLAAEPLGTAAPERARTPTRTPRQLPAGVGGFTGRGKEMADLDVAIASDARVIALHGPGGVGKTSIAVQWAQRQDFPDGHLFIDLRGYSSGEPLEVADALDALLRTLGVSGEQVPADADARASLLRSELADKRTLLLLDNAHDAAQVRPLLPGGGNIAVVTSRSQLRGLATREGAVRISVEPMPPDDAIELLRTRIRGDAEPHARTLVDLAELCGHLPVALAVAAERTARTGGKQLDAVIERLRDERDRIAALTEWDDDPGVRAVFTWSYEALDADTARMFRLLGSFPDSLVSLDAAAALGATDRHPTERMLDRLTDHHLLREIEPGSYELHDLTHAYAREVTANAEGASEVNQAVARLRSWYLHSTRNAEEALGARNIPKPIPAPVIGVSPASFATEADATSWFGRHFDTIRAILTDAATDGDHALIAALTPFLATYLQMTGAARLSVGLFKTAVRSAQQIGDQMAEAAATNTLGNQYVNAGDYATAQETLERARTLFAAVDRPDGSFSVETNLGVLFGRINQPADGAAHLERALEIARELGDPARTAMAQINLATACTDQGHGPEAVESAQTAVHIIRAESLPAWYLCNALAALGDAHAVDHDWSHAREMLSEAHQLAADIGHLTREVAILKTLGTAERELGDAERAKRNWQRALVLLERTGAKEVDNATAEELSDLIYTLPGRPELPC